MTKIILILLLILGIGAGVYLATSDTSFFGRADDSPFPKNILITNIDSDSFTVSYFTGKETRAFVNYGKDPSAQNFIEGRTTKAHSFNLNNLEPSTEYFIKIEGHENLYKVKTAPVISGDVPNGKTYKGIAVNAQNQLSEDAILYFRINGGQLLSVPVNADGSFSVTTNNYKNKDLNEYLDPNVFDKTEFLVQTADGALGYLISFAGNNRPLKILMEQNYIPFFKIQQGPIITN